MLVSELKKTIREVPDFPRPGINFYDLSTLFRDPTAYRVAVDKMVERFEGDRLDAIAGIEARGFILASAMAYRMGVGLILVRKAGKLPAATVSESYDLEYGQATLEVHRDAVESGQRVAVIDDLLATGGTAKAAGNLLESLGANVDGYGFLVGLKFLDGRKQLNSAMIFTLLEYE
jgi:adenine phosphoribosyltransferase